VENGHPTYSAAIHARRRQISRAWIARMRAGALIELKRGGPRRLFLVHDGEGETLIYLNLARRLPDDLAVLAIEPRQIVGVPLAHATIEEMAAFHIEEVRKNQPHGPYLLGGLCAGGVIAYEMAVQLIRAGETVTLLALLETATPKALERPRRILEQRLSRLKQEIESAKKSDLAPVKRAGMIIAKSSKKIVGALLWEILQRGKQCGVSVRFRLLREVLKRGLTWPRFVPELSVRQIYDSAHLRYAPKPLSTASVILVRAQTGDGDDAPYRSIYADATFGWKSLTPHLTVIDVDGGHSTMLEERFVDSLAKALLPHLQQSAEPVERPL
jgi:thioesterase domain-containing protein